MNKTQTTAGHKGPKLTKKVSFKIMSIIDQLDRGIAFIKSKDTLIGRRTGSTCSTVWKDENGIAHCSIAKDIGSELCCLYNARTALQSLITPVLVEDGNICPSCSHTNVTWCHKGGTFALPECNFFSCDSCGHQWGHA